MVFSSLSFIFFFLTITIACYFAGGNLHYRNGVLLLASLVFYSWGEPKLVLLMVAVSLIAYLCGLLLHLSRKKKILNLIIYIISIILITSNLVVFKYLNFFAENISAMFGIDNVIPKLTLPIGISFYTFQILSYVIDLRRGNVAVQKNPLKLLLYVSFFPQLIAGPIVRYSTVEEELNSRNVAISDVAYGAQRVILGLSKKVILSNGLAKIAEIIYAGDTSVYGSTMYWIAAISYALQIYFDFSGYSDMAIGLGRIFGFHFLENFDYPYISCSVTEFWRRWHISLSTWFRDYIYIPLGGNRKGKIRWLFNFSLVWLLTGLWHGASWNYIIWGAYYGIVLIIEKIWFGKKLDKCPKFVGWIYTAFIVLVGWVIFYSEDLSVLAFNLKYMFSFAPTNFFKVVEKDSAILKMFLYIPVSLLFIMPIKTWINAVYQNTVADFLSKCKPKKTFKEGNLAVISCEDLDEIEYPEPEQVDELATQTNVLMPLKFETSSKFKDPNFLSTLINNAAYLVLFGICLIYLFSSNYNPFIYFRF